MNKPIINGIDVSECYFYSDINCDLGYIADSFPINCKNNPNCYFKQFKRLEEECKLLHEAQEQTVEQEEELERLQEENDKLKEERNQAVNEFNALMTDIMIDIPFTGIKNTGISIKSHLRKMQKALKALEKIRHFIQVYVPEKESDYNSAKKAHPVFFGLLEQIKYHCNEVLNDRD